MNFLYHKFVEETKKEQIKQYNAKHRDYLIRVGKIKPEGQVRPIKSQRRQRQFQNQSHKPKPKETNTEYQQPIAYQNQQNQNFNYLRETEEPTIRQKSITFGNNPHQIQFQQRVVEKVENYSEEKEIYQSEPQRRKPSYEENYQKIDNRPLKKVHQEELEEYAEIKLVPCPLNCGRSFKPEAVQKHAKVCKKVFQQKRKPFQVKTTPQQADQVKAKTTVEQDKQKKKSKWKKDSENLRNMLKKGKGQLTKEQLQEMDDRIQCPHCQRKFNEDAAKRHIQICKKKSFKR